MSMDREQTTAIIVGGGIGGLAAGIALRRVGIDARIFERAPQVREVGAGLSLWPNGLRVLDALGLGDQVRARSVRDMHSALRTPRGRVLVATDGQALTKLLGDVSLVIHRAELLALLRSHLPDSAVITGATCRKFLETEDGVIASFSDGTLRRGHALIGADGIHSVVRAQLFGASPPRYAGYTAWRAAVSFDHGNLRPGVSVGRGSQFGQVPMADGRVYWFATQNTPPGTRRPPNGWRATLLDLFAGWHEPIPALIAATSEAEILHNDIVDRPPLSSWSKGRVTLLGDAAHPMTPNLGQGANQALEDATALASALATAKPDAVPAALRAYDDNRRSRANALIDQSRRVGRVMQLESPLACWIRDTLLGTRAASRMQMAQLKQLVAAPCVP